MTLPDFADWPVGGNLALFAGAAVFVWLAGTRVARLADRFAVATGVGQVAAGMLLLAGITSLPEVAVSLTSAAGANAPLAVNNLLGSIAMQVAILAVADAILGKDALTVVAGTSLVLLQVTMNVLLLVLLALALVVGDRAWLGAGLWTWGLLAAYALAVWTISHASGCEQWVARDRRPRPEAADTDDEPMPLRRILLQLAIGAAVILMAGFLLSRTGEAIAEQTGLGQSFAGAVLLAISTSLPEVSSVFAAMKLQRYALAISDIFGTNLFNIALVFVVDLVHPGPSVLGKVGAFALAGTLLGALLSAIFLVGLLERRNRTIARMGMDSLAVLLAYLGGLVLLYQLR